MTSPHLYIGVGGSGRQTLDWLYLELKRRLVDAGWPWEEREAAGHAMPRCWAFLGIDVESNASSGAGLRLPDGAITFAPLARFPEQMSLYYEMLRSSRVGLAHAGWVPSIDRLNHMNPYDGAGQRRAIGRVVAMAKMPTIVEALERAASSIASREATDDLKLVNRYLPSSDGSSDRKMVSLVSSLSGGSGSGMWLDIAQWLAGRGTNEADAWLRQNCFAYLYLPEVFELIKGPDQGIAPNSAHGMIEFLSACVDRAPFDPIARPLAAVMGITDEKAEEKAPRNVFFIGRRNEKYSLDRLDDVYAATASTLAAIAMSPVGINRFGVNRSAGHVAVPMLAHVLPPTSYIGYSRLELGRRRFASYAQRRIFRQIVRQLVFGYEIGRESRFDEDKAIIERIVNSHAERFFVRCGLNEYDSEALSTGAASERDQILNGLLPLPKRNELENARVDAIVGATKGWTRLNANERASIFKKLMRDHRRELAEELQIALLQNVESYGRDVRRAVLEATVEMACTYSVPVAIRLLERLSEQLRLASKQVIAEREGFTRKETELDGRLAAVKLQGRIDDFLTNLKEVVVFALTSSARAQVRDVAPGFIADVDACLIQPMIRALKDWLADSQRELTRDDSPWSFELRLWNGFDLPDDLFPAPNVEVIETVKNIPSEFETLVSGTFSTDIETGLVAAVMEIVKGTWTGAEHPPQFSNTMSSGQMFLLERRPFSFDTFTAQRTASEIAALYSQVLSPNRVVPQAEFETVTLQKLYDSTRLWLERRPGAISAHVNEGLGEWLNARQSAGAGERRDRVTSAWSVAVGLARPLVDYALSDVQRIHGSTEVKETLFVSPAFPVSGQSRTAQAIKQATTSALGDASTLDFSDNVQTDAVEIIRWYPDPIHPLAMKSFTGQMPTLLSSTDEGTWLARRSRPLAQALMLTPAQIVGFLRGWITLTLLKRVDSASGKVVFDSRPEAIPTIGLRGRPIQEYGSRADGATPSGWLRVALEGFPLAALAVGKNASTLDWYAKVLSFGGYVLNSQTAREQEQQTNAHGVDHHDVRSMAVDVPALAGWVVKADHPKDCVPDPSNAGPSGSTPEDREQRHEVLLKTIGDFIVSFEAAAESTLSSPGTSVAAWRTPELELFPYTITALHHLRSALMRSQAASKVEIGVPSGVEFP